MCFAPVYTGFGEAIFRSRGRHAERVVFHARKSVPAHSAASFFTCQAGTAVLIY